MGVCFKVLICLPAPVVEVAAELALAAGADSADEVAVEASAVTVTET